MVRTSFDGQTIAKVLRRHNYQPVGRTGSHLKLRWESPHTDEMRIVTVPMKPADKIPTGTMRSIAEQCGAKDFKEWCAWIDRNR
jgi:predicted RNA binding protein YcfA (HicA-like mRNA interferase family)